MTRFDFAIVGAGIAGASLAAELASHGTVLLIEAEDQPGYHATGRSAAFWSETYGGPGIQPLTSASGAYLARHDMVEPLGSLHIGRAADATAAEAFLDDFAGTGIALTPVDPHTVVPRLRGEWTIGIAEPSCAYIDVAALHQHYLARARSGGATLVTGARMDAADRDVGGWRIAAGANRWHADRLVNAAGAWADQVAQAADVQPLGLSAFRRTMVQLRTDPAPPSVLPHVAHIGGSFYFKPEAGGRLWLSPHDEIPSAPCDAAPEELDVAVAIDRLEQVVDWRIAGVERRWAGLRTFAPDRLPVYGFDARAPGFFWFAGQGGFGIQTAPAAALVAARLITGSPPDPCVAAIDPTRYAPARFG
ncbi:MAG: FAD-binding oxidoreductase [Sphingomonas sp.]|uniref:NAD(P)/FAD-dependent oxidoreductase n=1 Tax=Sphingomonas sp. TaxID=28214 RepID=UPI000DB29A36|nr:FAD-binding oxidoreductase [Sphingomonas sp.]PZP18084.1 MAG: FAD-dependent oxidoreductase [Sphingomonas hengshuiensis]